MKLRILTTFLFLCLATLGISQIDYDKLIPATSKIFINDVVIHDKPGSVIDFGDILIEDGIIRQIGQNIKQPDDAVIMSADSLFVYPAFIDGLSHTGIKSKEESEERPEVKFPGNPPNDIAGITPDYQTADFLDSSSGSIKTMREAGFGISHITRKGRMLPGQTALISLSGKASNDILLKSGVAQFAQLKSSPGVFPQTMIGVLTKFKELYKQAEGAKIHFDKYNRTPSGMKRPNYDDAIQAFIPVSQKQQKVFFKAKKAKDVHRILALKKELGMDLVLTDVSHVFPVIDKIKNSGSLVMLALELPEKPEGMKDDSGEEENEKEEGEEDEKDEVKEKEEEEKPIDPETEMLKKRQLESYTQYVTQAAALEKAGIKFGFSWTEAKVKDLQSNMQTLIENGLSEKAALAGLTTVPAEFLGISNVAGTAEKGKFGNLIISTKPIFEKGAKIKFMLVDGEIFEYEVKEKKKKSSGEEMDISGTYEYDIPTFGAAGKLVIEKDGDEYTAKISGDDDPNDFEEISEIEVDGNEADMNFTVTQDGFSMEIDMSLEFEESGFEGSVSTQFGSAPIEGSKLDPK